MATVLKTWAFLSDAEGLAAQQGSGITVAWFDNGNPAGSLQFNQIQKGATETEIARRTATGETWEDWGVPAGAVVTHVQITGYDERLATATKLTSHSLKARVVDSAGASVHSAGELLDLALDTDVEVAWQTGQAGGSQRAVDSAKQASNTDVRLELEWAVTTSSGGGNANVDQRFDNLALEITYAVVRTGDLAATDSPDAASMAGDVLVDGALSATDAPDAVAASGDVVVAGNLAATEAVDALSADGEAANAGTSGDLAATDSPDTLTGTGHVVVGGSLAATEALDVPAAAGGVLIEGGMAGTDPADVVAMAGDVIVAGALVATDPVDVAASAGTVLVSGDLSATEAADTFAAASSSTAQGDMAAVEAQDAMAAAGTVAVTGDLAASETMDGPSAAGEVHVSGSLSAIEAADIVVGDGYILVDGVLAVVEGADAFAASAVPLNALEPIAVATNRRITGARSDRMYGHRMARKV